MARSYKAVALLFMAGLADDSGRVSVDALAHHFYGFYLNRELLGLVAEKPPYAFDPPSRHSAADARKLLLRHPLERFRLAGFLGACNGGLVQLRPDEFRDCASDEVRSGVQRCCTRVLRHYYQERIANG
jgi:hypothetical protein